MARLTLLIPILTLFCACGPATAGQEQFPTGSATLTANEATASPTEKPTDTMVPATSTAEDTSTPEASPTPEATATTAVIPYKHEAPKTQEDFTPVTAEEKATTMREILSTSVLPDKPSMPFRITAPREMEFGTQIQIGPCMWGDNCAIRACLQETTPYGPMNELVIEASTETGKIVFAVSATSVKYEYEWNELLNLQKANYIGFVIMTSWTGKGGPMPTPLMFSLTNDAPDQQTLRDIENGIFPNTLPYQVLQVIHIIYMN